MAENFQNFYVTKLREACDASATTIYVDNPPNFSEGTLVIEFSNSTKHEIIHFTGKSGYGLTGCTRGHEGTTAQSHSAGVDVRQNVTAGILDKIINRAITTENIADGAVTTAKIDNGAVTANKIDFTTIDVYPEKTNDINSSLGNYLSFDLDVSTTESLFYDVNISAHSPSATPAGGFGIMTPNNKSGPAWTRRIGYENEFFSDENNISETDTAVCYFTRNKTGGTGSLAGFITGTVLIKASTSQYRPVRGIFFLHASDVCSSMVATFEANIMPTDGKITLSLERTHGQLSGCVKVYKKK